MNRLLTVLLTITILLTTSIVTSTDIVSDAEAAKGQGVSVSKYGSQTKDLVCGDRLCSEIPGGRQAYEEPDSEFSPTVTQQRMSGDTCNCAGDCNCGIDGTCTCTGEEGPCVCGPSCTCGADMHSSDGTCSCGSDGTCSMCGQMSHGKSEGHTMKTESGTMTSSQDPGLGHENHQLALLLPPSDDLYKGMVTYSASQNIQLVVLHGPLAEGEDMGQPIWTPDGETKFAMTLVDPQNKAGSWMFAGNALAVHAMNSDPFTVSYSMVTMDGSGTMKDGTCQCSGDCNCSEDGVCNCAGVDGPCMCGSHCNCGQ